MSGQNFREWAEKLVAEVLTARRRDVAVEYVEVALRMAAGQDTQLAITASKNDEARP